MIYPSINHKEVVSINNANILILREDHLPINLNRETVKEINRRIFDGVQVTGYTPGTFRRAEKPGSFNLSSRILVSQNDRQIFSMRSLMDENALKRLDTALYALRPDRLKMLNTDEFTKQISVIYANLDYTHPFIDGNSRTFRTFTEMAAQDAGFDLNWDKISFNQYLRDELYCARSIEVNRLALSDPDQSANKEYISNMLAELQDKRDLNQLLKQERIITPTRAIAFQKGVQQCFNHAQMDALQFKHELLEICRQLSVQYPEIKPPLIQLSGFLNTMINDKNDLQAYQNLSLKVLPAFYKELEAGKVDISLENTANVQNAKNTKSASRR